MATANERQADALERIAQLLGAIARDVGTLASTVKPDAEPPAVSVKDVTEEEP